MSRFNKFVTTLVAAVAVMLGTSGRADAGLRLTLSTPGSATQQFFSDTNALQANATIGGYSVVLSSVLTNFPGNGVFASLTNTLNIATNAGPVNDLTVLVEVVTSPANAGSPLAPFTNVPGGPPFQVRNNLTGSSGQSVTSGEGDMSTIVNGTSVNLNDVSLPGLIDARNGGNVATPPSQFTLAQQLVISGLPANVQPGDLGITATSNVTAVPAPAGLLLLAAGAPALGVGAWLRRRKAVTA